MGMNSFVTDGLATSIYSLKNTKCGQHTVLLLVNEESSSEVLNTTINYEENRCFKWRTVKMKAEVMLN